MSALPLVPPASPAVLDRDQLRALLQDQQFAEVERLLDGVQDAHRRGELDDRELWRCYSVAHCFRADLTGAFETWRLQRPSSPQGMLCRALHASGRYFSLRTYRLAKDIPAEHQAGMRQQYGLADRLSQQLTQTHPDLLVVWWLRINLAMCQGQQNWSDYRQGLTHHPHSLRLRKEMLSALRTEWGGTDAAQLAFLERPEHAQLSDLDRRALEAQCLAQRAHYHGHFRNNRAGAQEVYEDALDFVRDPSILASAAALYRPLRARKMAHEALAMRPWDDGLRTAAAMADLMAWWPARKPLAALRKSAEWGEPLATDLLQSRRLTWELRRAGVLMLFLG